MSKNRQLRCVDFSIHLTHEREVDPGNKLDSRGAIGITLATIDLETVNPVLVDALIADGPT